MPAIPLQFVIALLLIIFLVRLLRRDGGPPSRLFVLMIAAYALQSTLHGLRWGYGIEAAILPHPFLAAIIPPLSWVAFSDLATSRTAKRPWLHLLPLVLVVLLYIAFPPLVHVVTLVAIAVGYGVALIMLGRAGPDALDRIQLDGAITMQRALEATGYMMIAEACVDVAITIDFIRAHGAHAAWIAGVASLFFITVLGFAAVIAGESVPSNGDRAAPEPPAPVAMAGPEPSEAEDGQVMAALDALMQARHLYRDPELSLDRLARKALIPTRRISGAVNRTRDMNVSQYVNGFRIDEARRRLAESDDPVTQIMLEVGFLTKSNFNREFLRVTGKSPSAWRAHSDQAKIGDQAQIGQREGMR